MRVRMRVSISGTHDGQDWPPSGVVVDVPKHEAEHLITGGMAVAAGDVETADAPPAETATVDTTPRRRKR